MKTIVMIAACIFAACMNPDTNNQHMIGNPTASHTAVFTIESVVDVDTISNVIHYMDYDAFDPDNMDWCAAYDAATDRITATTDHETAVLIASGKVDIWNAEQFTLWFDESGKCTLKHDCHWLE